MSSSVSAQRMIPNGVVALGALEFIVHSAVHVHLADVLMCDFAGLEVDEDEALEDVVVENEVYVVVFFFGVDVLLTGHTHVPACENHIDYIYCNPGSVGIPKGGSVRSFMTLEGSHLEWHSLEDGHVYMHTDI